MDAPDVKRGRPAVAREAELGQLLVRPPGDDRLARGVAGGMIIKAAIGTGLGVAARPDALVDRVDRRLIAGCVPPQQHLQGRRVERPFGQGTVQAAPAAAVCRLQAQVRQRGDWTRCQEGINQLEQGVGTSREAAVQLSTEAAQGLKVISGHAAQLARPTDGQPGPLSTSLARVKSQA